MKVTLMRRGIWDMTHGVSHGGGPAISDDDSDSGHVGSGPHVLGKHLSADRIQSVSRVGAASHVLDVVDTLQQRGSRKKIRPALKQVVCLILYRRQDNVRRT